RSNRETPVAISCSGTRIMVNGTSCEIHARFRARGHRASGRNRGKASGRGTTRDRCTAFRHPRCPDAQSKTPGTTCAIRRHAVLVAPADEEDLERLVLGRSARFQAILNKSRRSIQEGKGLSRDDFWKAVRKRRRGDGPQRGGSKS